MNERNKLLLKVMAALRANDGIGSAEEAVETVRALLDAEGAAAEREIELLCGNDGFCDMVVREAEATILTAGLDELVAFAYGDWAEARAAWRRRQRSRFRRPRRLKVKAA
jgi:hypothetical protein